MRNGNVISRLLTLVAIIFLAAGYSYSQTNSSLPPELLNLRTQYKTKIKAATNPIRTTYINDLRNLLDQLTRRGNLDAALVVRREIEQASSYDFLPDEGLVILKATYGLGKKQNDATKKVRSMVQNNSLTVAAEDALFGDPLPGIPKVLEIKYRYKGVEETIQIPEWTKATIP